MYQIVYPWINPTQFQIQIQKNTYNHLAPQCEQDAFEKLQKDAGTNNDIKLVDNNSMKIIPNNADAADPGITIYSASKKLQTFIAKRDAHVVYHGANTCTDNKPWNQYKHFHVTYCGPYRPGSDSLWNNVVCQHRALVDGTGNIPATQMMKFLSAWANYLSTPPR